MDSFINLAKQGYETYQSSQGSHSEHNVSRTGGHEYNSPHHSQQDQNQGQNQDDGGNYRQGNHSQPDFDDDEVVNNANEAGSGDRSLFSSALDFAKGNKHEHNKPIDEEHVTNAHRQAYEDGDTSGMSAGSMGSAAAMQILKQFTSGGGSSGGSKSQLISMAMAEASKLFDSSGGAASGNKQDAVNGAAMTVMKLVVQSKFSSAIGGGNSGGLGSLMGLASKFM